LRDDSIERCRIAAGWKPFLPVNDHKGSNEAAA
jgi:hypothetical protein